MNIKLIKTKKDYQQALNRLEVIFDAKPNTPEGDEMEVLGLLIETYEKEHFPWLSCPTINYQVSSGTETLFRK